MRKPIAVDLFSGAGGLSLGLKQAGWSTLLACEFDAAAAATYRANFENEVICQDIREIDWSSLVGKVDLVAGGPPCQPFSVAGNQRASADSRDMLPEFVRAVRQIRPALFLMENVAGLVSSRNSTYFAGKVKELSRLGYEVSWAVLDASDYGVPQSRKRVIVLGSRQGRVSHPEATHGPGKVRRVPSGTVVGTEPAGLPNHAITTYAANPVLRPSPWAGMLVNGGGRPVNLEEPSPTIPASAGGNRTHIVDPLGVLRDYHAHLIAGGAPRSGVVQGVRRLTVQESARLQTFPDSFHFVGKPSAKYRQIGNAVPPKLGEAVGRCLLAAL